MTHICAERVRSLIQQIKVETRCDPHVEGLLRTIVPDDRVRTTVGNVTTLNSNYDFVNAIQTPEFRYQLRGVIAGLTACQRVSTDLLKDSDEILFPRQAVFRIGRAHSFLLRVTAKGVRGERVHEFPVAAANAWAAYLALKKRVVFRALPDIQRVEVFQGDQADSRELIQVFEDDALSVVALF